MQTHLKPEPALDDIKHLKRLLDSLKFSITKAINMSKFVNIFEQILSGELAKIIPYIQNNLHRLEATRDLPKWVRIGANRVAWLKDEVENCIAERVLSREGVSL